MHFSLVVETRDLERLRSSSCSKLTFGENNLTCRCILMVLLSAQTRVSSFRFIPSESPIWCRSSRTVHDHERFGLYYIILSPFIPGSNILNSCDFKAIVKPFVKRSSRCKPSADVSRWHLVLLQRTLKKTRCSLTHISVNSPNHWPLHLHLLQTRLVCSAFEQNSHDLGVSLRRPAGCLLLLLIIWKEVKFPIFDNDSQLVPLSSPGPSSPLVLAAFGRKNVD